MAYKAYPYSAASPTLFLMCLMTHSCTLFGTLWSVPFTFFVWVALTDSVAPPPLSFPGDEEFLFRREKGGRLCLLHVVSTWRVDLLRGRGLCAVLLQHYHWQARENPHGTVRPHSTCCISTRSVSVWWIVIYEKLKCSLIWFCFWVLLLCPSFTL